MYRNSNDSGREDAAQTLRAALLYLPDREDFRYFASERAEGEPPAYTSLLLEYSGMVIFRSSWEKDALWAYMDASPFGKAHQHEDKLSVQLWAFGHELMPEAGTFDYDTSEMRRYVLSTRGHNTARIDGFDQNRRDGYRWSPEDIHKKADVRFEIGETRETAEASYEEGYGPGKIRVRHTRKLIFLKREPALPPMFVSVDRFEAEEEHSCELIWHLHDNPTVLVCRSVHNTFGDGVGVTVASSCGGMQVWRGVKTPEFQGWLPKFGIGDVEHYAVPTVLNTFRFRKPHRVVTVLCPYADGNPPVRSVEASDDFGASEFTVVLRDGSSVTVRE
ncbi:MAG: heparinase II/III-family protein [Clostridia bacterium]|nr:heparinase II/III-family protein [Clostridia bacterium]